MTAPPTISLLQLFLRFLRFGALAFGGPVAQIGMLRHELVDRERWTTELHFLRALAVYQALPGPEAHELCCWFGHLARGRRGALVAGLGFMLPGTLLVLLSAILYVEFGMGAALIAAVFAGLQPAVVALIVRAVPRIGAQAIADRWLWGAVAFGAMAEWNGLPFWLPLMTGMAAGRARKNLAATFGIAAVTALVSWWLWPPAVTTASLPAPGDTTLGTAETMDMLWLGLQAGLVTFGGAYTAIPVARAEAVAVRGWMTDAQFLDGIAITGVLPAPLVAFCTFTGYVSGGLMGAVMMTIGVFAPAFSFTLIGHQVFERLVGNARLHSALDGVVAGVVGLIAATAAKLALEVLDTTLAVAIFGISLAIAWLWKSGRATVAVIALGALAGLLAGLWAGLVPA